MNNVHGGWNKVDQISSFVFCLCPIYLWSQKIILLVKAQRTTNLASLWYLVAVLLAGFRVRPLKLYSFMISSYQWCQSSIPICASYWTKFEIHAYCHCCVYLIHMVPRKLGHIQMLVHVSPTRFIRFLWHFAAMSVQYVNTCSVTLFVCTKFQAIW